MLAVDLAVLALLQFALLTYGTRLSSISRLPSITLFLLVGACCRVAGVFTANTVSGVQMLHHAMLAVITFAAGAELELDALLKNFKLVRSLALSLTASALVCVFCASLVMSALLTPDATSADESGDGTGSATVKRVSAMLAAVVAIARSPSSAIGVVNEVRAEGPFTLVVLSVTMVTDVVVIVLFTAAVEVADTVLSPSADGGLGRAFLRFGGRTAIHLAISTAHAAALALLCLLTLRLPASPTIIRPTALLGVGAFAFGAERGLHLLTHGGPLDEYAPAHTVHAPSGGAYVA